MTLNFACGVAVALVVQIVSYFLQGHLFTTFEFIAVALLFAVLLFLSDIRTLLIAAYDEPTR